jgi:hypothetical protein
VIVFEGHLYELQKAQPRRHAAWFLDQYVSSDNSIYLASKIDIRFLILPYFEASDKKYSPLNQLVYDHDSIEDKDSIPLHLVSKDSLMQLFDMNDKMGDDMILYRYNEDKCLDWLELKVRSCASTLAKIRENRDSEAALAPGFNLGHQRSSSVVGPVDASERRVISGTLHCLPAYP